MKIRKFKRALSLTVTAVFVLSLLTVISSTVASAAVYPGDEASGITVTSGTEAGSLGPNDSFMNGDFSLGFQYWCPTVAGDCTATAGMVLEGTNKVLNLNATSAYTGLVTPVFKLAGVAAGDKLVVVFDYKSKDGTILTNNQANLQIKLMQRYSTGTGGLTTAVQGSNNTIINEATATDAWATASVSSASAITANSGSPSDSYAGAYFQMYIQSGAAGPVPMYIDNIRIYKNINNIASGITDNMPVDLNHDIYGTKELGMTTNNINLGPINYFTMFNGSFDQGLRFWEPTSTGSASEYANVITEGSNKYIELTKTASYAGIKTPKVKISPDKIAAGDKLCVVFDYKSKDGSTLAANGVVAQFKIEQRYPTIGCTNSSNSVILRDVSPTSGWAVARTAPTSAVAASEATVDGGYIFYVTIQTNAAPCNAYIDNVRICKLDADGTTVRDLNGTVLEFEDTTYGTYKDGITGTGPYFPNGQGPLPSYINGDFQYGLKYWCSNLNGTTKASDAVTLKSKTSDPTDNYISLKGTGSWQGLRSPQFLIPESKLSVGDRLVLIFDYKGIAMEVDNSGALQLKLDQRFIAKTGGIQSCAIGTNDVILTRRETPDEWATARTNTNANATVAARDTAAYNGAYYVFHISVQTGAEALAGRELSIDNIRIAKLSADNVTLTDLDGNVLKFDPGYVPPDDDGSNDNGSNDNGSNDNGSNDNGSNDNGSNDNGSNDNGSNDNGSNNDDSSTDGGDIDNVNTGDSTPIIPVAVVTVLSTAIIFVLRKRITMSSH